MASLDNVGGNEWRSVSVRPTASGLTAREKFSRFQAEPITEMALRSVGVLMVASAILMWFLLEPRTLLDDSLSQSALASFLAAGGLGVFAFGTRGFSRQMSLDVDTGTLCLTKINIKQQARVARQIKLGEIESVFLRRPESGGRQAMLLVRIMGHASPVIGLTGDTNEIEALHRQLCAVMKSATSTAPGPSVRLDRRAVPKRRLFSA